MKKLYLPCLLCIALLACNTELIIDQPSSDIAVVPYPKEITISGKGLVLTEKSSIQANDPTLQPLVHLFQQELLQLTGVALDNTSNKKAAILFEIDSSLGPDAYHLSIEEKVLLKGGSYQALAMAKNTLLQLVKQNEKGLILPALIIKDEPDAAYRGLLIDLARKWHSLATVKQLIDLAAFYKVNYLHLHFTDYQSYTLPSKHYPKLATPSRHYSVEELREMEAYSQLRGVTIIPEIDVPGHSSPFVKKYPEIFAIQDTVNNPYIINMGRAEVYQALDLLIGEVLSIFTATPYFHIGGDEAYFAKVLEDSDVQAYMAEHQLGEIHELYRHFLIRMNTIVKKHGKQMCVWEGFSRQGNISIPKDILVFEFETNKYLPNDLVEDGYTVVNTSWKPLYVVNQKKWSPKTIYNWNIWRWENWWDRVPSFTPIQLKPSPKIIGAEMCAWEQPDSVEIPSIRKRLPSMMERIWNQEEKIPYEQFATYLEQTDQRLSKLINDDRQDDLLEGYEFSGPLADRLTKATSADGQFIAWKEHLIDDTALGGEAISGSDGLSIGDLDQDGYIDIVSVHESDTEYDGALEGTIRIAFGSANPDKWELITLAKGSEAAAAEDVALEDINGDGYLDVVAACELAHLIYFQNPTKHIRTTKWERMIPKVTQNRGSFIRVFTADLNQDGQAEIIAANKGDQLAGGTKDLEVQLKHPISYFEIKGNPMEQSAWKETELINVSIPINSQPIDIDQDGDVDIIAGSRGENRIFLFENVSTHSIRFNQHAIELGQSNSSQFESLKVNGFNMDYVDINKDNRLDIVLCEIEDVFPLGSNLVWLEQPSDWAQPWTMHTIGNTAPDRIVGLTVADINNDGKEDVFVGTYSRGDRAKDGAVDLDDPLGRLAWFEQPTDLNEDWIRHDVSRRKRGMFDKFIPMDIDQDGDMDFLSTRGNSVPYDGVFWLEQIKSEKPINAFKKARKQDSEEVGLNER